MEEAYYIRLSVLFQNRYIYDDRSCQNSTDNDVAGPGVVSAFTATAGLTVFLSVCAAILDGTTSPGGVLPDKINRWIQRASTRKLREQRDSWREVLDRTMIALADQQLLTGIAIIISGYVRANDNSIFREDWPYPSRLQENHFHLILYMSCLSSSAHLACLITLKKYFSERSVPALVRLTLVVVFALLLGASFFMSFPFGMLPLAQLILVSTEKENENGYQLPSDSVYALLYCADAVVVALVLYPFWIAIINIFEDWNEKIQSHVRNIWHSNRRWLPTYWFRALFRHLRDRGRRNRRFWQRIERFAKSTFWFLLLGSTRTAFFHQLLFSLVSLAFVLAQKVANSPDPDYCDLTSTGPGRWGFGQILPMILLGQPLLSAVAAYYEEFGKKPKRESNEQSHALLSSSEEPETNDMEMQSLRRQKRQDSGSSTG